MSLSELRTTREHVVKVKGFEGYDFTVVRNQEHVSLLGEDADGQPLYVTLPRADVIKGSTLLVLLDRADFGIAWIGSFLGMPRPAKKANNRDDDRQG